MTMRPVAPAAPRGSRRLRAAAAALLLAAALPATLRAQVEERPVTFDAGQRMTAITPMLAARMKLAAPAWPVTGDFREARAYAAGDAHVLVVQKGDGSLVRYPLDAGQWGALQAAVTEGMRVSGNPAGEPGAHTYSEVAGTRFARRQLVVGALLYGPLLSAFADDGSSAGALYLTGAAVPSLMAIGFARDGMLLKSQTDLGMDGSLRGALLGSFAHRAIQGDEGDGEARAGAALAGSVALTAAGLGFGRRLTDGEASGMIAGSNYTLGITSGVMGALGAFEPRREACVREGYYLDPSTGQYVFGTVEDTCERSGTSRAEWATLLGAGLVGYPLGLAYVRNTRYAVTAGDANALAVPAGVGALLGATLAGDSDDEKTVWGAVTGGLVLGLVAGDRLLVKPFDYTRSQGTALRVGAIAGGVAGLIVPTLSESDDARSWFASSAIGAGLGAAFAHAAVRPRRAMSRDVLREARRDGPTERRLAGGVTWQIDPMGAAMAAARAPGRHGILSLTF